MTIIIDLITTYHTAFFLNVLNSKNIFIIVIYGIIIDFLIAYTNGLVILFLIISYFLKRYLSNYYLYNMFIFTCFYFIFFQDIFHFLNSFSLQLTFIYLNKNHIIKW